MEVADTWASLLPDLLLDIFRRLEATDVVFRCAGACKPWRRAIIGGNATSLRPRPDCFVPSLLLGIFRLNRVSNQALLRRVPGPLQSALPSTDNGYEVAEMFIPAGIDRARLYPELRSSRDGFILLMGRRVKGLCLCNPMTGDCAFLHTAAVKSCTYILLTGYDLSPTCSRNDSWLGVQILAVAGTDTMRTDQGQMTYQLFSFTTGDGGAGAWGPVKRSEEMEKGLVVFMQGRSTVVCRDAVYWLAAGRRPTAVNHYYYVTCTVGLDVRTGTGRAWTTEIPTQCHFQYYRMSRQSVLATSGDGRLSVITSLPGHQIHVWVLIGDGGQWTLRQTIDLQNQLPQCPEDKISAPTLLTAFCPRSGCVIGVLSGQEIRIDIESSSCVSAKSIGDHRGYCCYPYEMDWSTYISKMKHF